MIISKRILPIVGSIDEKLFANVADLIGEYLISGAPDLVVLITSTGGDVNIGLDIYDLVNTYPGKTTGVVLRQANSMAAIILQACTERIASKHSDILIHHIARRSVSLDIFNDESGAKLEELKKDMRRKQDYLYDILVKRTKKELKEITETCAKDRPMPYEEAQKFGLVDRALTKEDMATWFRPEALKVVEQSKT